ncbi:MAG: ComF family protein [Gammaproteobacteria bacterium]
MNYATLHWKPLLKQFFNTALDVVLPRTCILCHKIAQQDYDLCLNCEKELPWIKQNCPICSTQLPTTLNAVNTDLTCGQCLQNPPVFERTFALFRYEPPITTFISSLKFGGKLVYIDIFSKLLIKKIRQNYHSQSLPQIIIPVPLHTKRLRQRGFNQALELAQRCAIGIPVNSTTLHRTRHTLAQAQLPAVQRIANVDGAFKLTKRVRATHIALVDDVVTTGNTINACCKVLKASGVKTIDVWCVAKTHY